MISKICKAVVCICLAIAAVLGTLLAVGMADEYTDCRRFGIDYVLEVEWLWNSGCYFYTEDGDRYLAEKMYEENK